MIEKIPNQAYQYKSRGMAMLSVLFIIIAIVVVSMGYLHRSDMAVASGHNMVLRTECDYLVWAGVEHARAKIQAAEPNALLSSWSASGLQLESGSNLYYDVSISEPNNSTGVYVYPFVCEAYVLGATDKQARSALTGRILYDPNDGKTVLGRISRP